MKCQRCNKGETPEWIHRPCAYCGGTGNLPDNFSEIMKLKRCKKCGGEAVFSGVFDDPPTYRFPECMECGARAEGNRVEDSWAEREQKWNEQNTPTNEEWRQTCSTEEFAKFLEDVTSSCYHCGMTDDISQCAFQKHQCNIKEWLKEKYDGRLCEMDSQRV